MVKYIFGYVLCRKEGKFLEYFTGKVSRTNDLRKAKVFIRKPTERYKPYWEIRKLTLEL